MNKKRKVAIYGGTFDPWHKGHSDILKNLVASHRFHEIWVVPQAQHSQKKSIEASLNDRMRMIELSIEQDIFKKQPDTLIKVTFGFLKYSVYYIEFLKKNFPETEFFFVMGTDCLTNLSSWYLWEEFLENNNFVFVGIDSRNCINRPKEIEQKISELKIKKYYILKPITVSAREHKISSSDIRNRIKNEDNFCLGLHKSTYKYIRLNSLYE